MKKILLFLLVLSFNAQAEKNCAELPDCEALGYYKGSDTRCDSDDSHYIRCPYDKNYKRCVEYNCAKIGFTQTDKSAWCAKVIPCKNNPSYTLCAEKK